MSMSQLIVYPLFALPAILLSMGETLRQFGFCTLGVLVTCVIGFPIVMYNTGSLSKPLSMWMTFLSVVILVVTGASLARCEKKDWYEAF